MTKLDDEWASEIEATAGPFADRLQEATFQHHDDQAFQLFNSLAIPSGFFSHERPRLRKRLCWAVRERMRRIRDAWAVLRGSAWIEEPKDYED